MIKVRIPTPLRKLTGGLGEVAVVAEDITTLINALETAYPGLKDRICDERGEVRRFINIYINEEDIRFQKGVASTIKSGDEVSIVPAIAGGAATAAGEQSRPVGPPEKMNRVQHNAVIPAMFKPKSSDF